MKSVAEKLESVVFSIALLSPSGVEKSQSQSSMFPKKSFVYIRIILSSHLEIKISGTDLIMYLLLASVDLKTRIATSKF